MGLFLGWVKIGPTTRCLSKFGSCVLAMFFCFFYIQVLHPLQPMASTQTIWCAQLRLYTGGEWLFSANKPHFHQNSPPAPTIYPFNDSGCSSRRTKRDRRREWRICTVRELVFLSLKYSSAQTVETHSPCYVDRKCCVTADVFSSSAGWNKRRWKKKKGKVR